MLTGVLSDICVILVLGVGAGGLILLLLYLLDRLVGYLLMWLKFWRLLVEMVFGRCPALRQAVQGGEGEGGPTMTEDANRKCKTCRWWQPEIEEAETKGRPKRMWGPCDAPDNDYMAVEADEGAWAQLLTAEDFWCKCWEARP